MLYHVFGQGKKYGSVAHLSEREIADVAASFQAALVDTLVKKTVAAARRANVRHVALGGGVAANSLLRTQLAERCAEFDITLISTPMAYCTDNAAMIAAHGYRRFQAGRRGRPVGSNRSAGLMRPKKRH